MSISYVPGRGLQRCLRHKTFSLVLGPDKQPNTIHCRKDNGGNVHRSCWCTRRTWSRLWQQQEEGERFTLRWTWGGAAKKNVKGRKPVFERLNYKKTNKIQPFSEDEGTSQEMLPMKFTQISFQTQTHLVEETIT